MKRILVWVLPAVLMCAACGKKDEGGDKPADKPAVTPTDKPADPPKPADDQAALIERGKYVAQISGCPLCHTPMGPQGPDMSKMFAGGLEVKEPFGTWRSPNITNHEETGLGKWTDEQIIAAVRQGKRPDGSGLYPIMPFMFYNHMSDDDAKALVAFLRAAPAVENKIERVELKLPTADKLPIPDPAGKAPGDDVLEQGKYLTTLAHCGACHVPFDEKVGMPDYSRMFAGGMPMELQPPFGEGVVYAANITSDEETGIGKYTEEDIIAAMKTMKKKDGKPIVFPMALYAPVFAALSDDDAMAIAKFIKSLPPVKNKVPESKYKLSPPPGGAPPPAGKGG